MARPTFDGSDSGEVLARQQEHAAGQPRNFPELSLIILITEGVFIYTLQEKAQALQLNQLRIEGEVHASR